MTDTFAPDGEQPEVIPRSKPEPEEARAKLVSRWISTVQGDKAHWKDDFKRMRKDMEFAKFGADGQWKKSGKYVANILQRHINQKIATLYAKNPKAFITRSERMDFKIWDGSMGTLEAAQAVFAANPFDTTAQELIQDVFQGLQRRNMFDKIGQTMVILFHYFIREGSQNFKRQAKTAVRRALVTGISYCELGFQRQLEKRPEIAAEIADATNRLATLEALSADLADGQLQEDSADMENLKLMLRRLQNEQEMIVREGLVFDWPKSTEIIIDKNTVSIEGWIGTGHITREFEMTAQQIKEVYKVDITQGAGSGRMVDGGGQAPINTRDGNTANQTAPSRQGKHFVWRIWDKRTGHELHVMEGWPDFLKEPDILDTEIEQFFPLFPLQFNPVEDDQEKAKDTRVYGLSEIELLSDMQKGYNSKRQGLREHRHANRPGYAAMKGLLEAEDKALLENHPPNAVVELNVLFQGQKIEEVIQAVPKIPIDPAVYDVGTDFEDIQRTVGVQEANTGGLRGRGVTATEVSVSEGSRVTATQSNVDDLDDFLTVLARAGGQVLLLNMSREIVTQIAGPGSVWPEFTSQQVAEEVFLEVRAGSSGRPNKQLEIANFERMVPFLLQLPGIQPEWLAEKMIERLDDGLDLEDAFLAGLPSVIAMNAIATAQAQPVQGGAPGENTAGGPNDPAAQGGAGAQNAPQPPAEPGPQAAFPAGAPGV